MLATSSRRAITFADWLLSPGAHVVLANRGLRVAEVAQLTLSVLLSVVDPRNVVQLIDTPDPQIAPNGSLLTNYLRFNAQQARGKIIFSGAEEIDYIKLKELNGMSNLIIVLGYGVAMHTIGPIIKYFQPQIIQALFPATQWVEINVLEAVMSEYQLKEYRWIRSREIAAGKASKIAGENVPPEEQLPAGVSVTSILLPNPNGGEPKPARPRRKANAVYSPERLMAYQSNAEFHALERANFVYPPALQLEYNMESDAKGERRVLADKLNYRGGWISVDTFNELEQYGCKIPLLLQRVTSRIITSGNDSVPGKGNGNNATGASSTTGTSGTSPTFAGKYVICTQFRNHHGLELLASLLEIYGISGNNGLLFQLHGGIKPNNRGQVVQQFNAAGTGVLLLMSELKLDFELVGVDEIIVFEGTDARTLLRLLDLTFSYEHYSTAHKLQMTLLAARISETQGSVDQTYHKIFLEVQKQMDDAYNMALVQAVGLVMENGRWMVTGGQQDLIRA